MAADMKTGTGASFSSPADWYNQYLSDLTTMGGKLAQREYTPYTGPRVAEWTGDQQAAFAGIRDAQGMWQPYVEDALGSMNAGMGDLSTMRDMTTGAGKFMRGTPTTFAYNTSSGDYGPGGKYEGALPSSIGLTDYDNSGNYDANGKYTGTFGPTTSLPAYKGSQPTTFASVDTAPDGMNYDQFYDVYQPHLQAAQNAADAIGNRNFQNTTLKSLNDNFAGTGQFGSGRHQILGADAAALAQTEIEEMKAKLGLQTSQNAMGNYMDWSKQQGNMGAQMGQLAGNQARMGTDFMNFGLGTQQAAMADATAMGNIGQQQQTQNQQNLNLAYQDFQEQQQYPWQQLDKWSAMTRQQSIPNYQSNISLPGVTPGTQQNPWVQGITGGLNAWNTMNTAFRN